MDESIVDRRTLLRDIGMVGIAGGFAGCGSGGSSSSGRFDGYLSRTSNFDGVIDETGQSRVTIAVGARGNGGYYAFDPAAVRIDVETTVAWEWTGNGTRHNVVHDGGEFQSGLSGDEGHVFEHTFREAGTYRYYCTPHERMGMRGVIVVE